MKRLGARAAWLVAALAGAPSAFAADAPPPRVALVRPAHADALTTETATRLQAELLAAGFAVVLVDAAPDVDPRAEVEADATPSRPVAAVAILRTARGAAADVWVTDRASRRTVVRRVDLDATAESSPPAALAIRAVELLRASLAEAAAPAPPVVAPPAVPLPAPAPPPSPPPPPPLPPPGRALFAGASLELGLAAIYGLGETGGRLAPTLRFAYGAALGLAGRFTLVGPTATDQLALVELTYGFDRSWQLLAPVVSVGVGGSHTHLLDSGGPMNELLRTEAWTGLVAAGAGVAARATDRAAILFDTHVLVGDPGPGAWIGHAPGAGRAQLLGTVSLGVIAGF